MDLYLKGEIQAVSPVSVFSISEVQQAMRMMQSGKHMGKVVIEAKDDYVLQVTKREPFFWTNIANYTRHFHHQLLGSQTSKTHLISSLAVRVDWVNPLLDGWLDRAQNTSLPHLVVG